MNNTVYEDPRLAEAAQIFQDTINNLQQDLHTFTTDTQREDTEKRIRRIKKELSALNRIRRLFRRRKRRGDTIC